MANEKSTSTTGIGIGGIIFLIFLTLKLAGIGQVATWSWWWVFSPFWIPILIGLIILIVAVIMAAAKK